MANIKNEKIKRKYLGWMRDAVGFSETSISSIEKAIWLYEDFTRNADFAEFSQRKAIGFKKWLSERKHNGNPISAVTIYYYLRHMKRFLTWLSGQPGYKSRINLDNVSYLSLDKKTVREVTSARVVEFPTLEYITRLADSIEIRTEIDQRDRAIIAFLLLSGMRDKAVATLPLGCFDTESLKITQDPKYGVDTKFGKVIPSILLKFDKRLVEYVVEWAIHLKSNKLFSDSDPLFPRSKVQQVSGGLAFISREVEPIFWKGTGSIRHILEKRAGKAGLQYYHPHTFRHAAIQLAMRRCHNAEEMRAISQNFGHEHIGTTLLTYGKLDDHRVNEVIDKIDFNPSSKEEDKARAKDLLHELGRLI